MISAIIHIVREFTYLPICLQSRKQAFNCCGKLGIQSMDIDQGFGQGTVLESVPITLVDAGSHMSYVLENGMNVNQPTENSTNIPQSPSQAAMTCTISTGFYTVYQQFQPPPSPFLYYFSIAIFLYLLSVFLPLSVTLSIQEQSVGSAIVHFIISTIKMIITK